MQQAAELKRSMAMRVAGVSLVSAAIWAQQYFLFDREIFPHRLDSLLYRSGEAAICVALVAVAVATRRLSTLRWATAGLLSLLCWVHAFAMLRVADDCLIPFLLTFEWGHIAIALVASLDFLPAAVFLGTTWGVAVLVNFTRPGFSADISDLLVVLVVYAAVLASIRAWDKLREVANRTSKQLEAANEALRTADNVRSRLFANLSHDFRTPLTLADNEAQLLRDEVPHPAWPGLDRLRGNLRTMTELTEQLLDMARLDAGLLEPKVRTFALLPLVSAVAAQFDEHFGSGTLNLRETTSPDESPAKVSADPVHVRRIVTNLLSNAVRELARGASRIELRVCRQGPVVLLEVCDDGAGIPDKLRAQLFVRFASAQREDHTGLGIGLPVARELARANGGDVRLAPSARGALLQVLLPASDAPPDESSPPTESLTQEEPPSTRRGYRVLVVEENAELRRQLAVGLTPEFTVIAVGSLRDLETELRDWQPDLLLSSFLLPDGDGWRVMAALRARRQARHTPLVFLSSVTDEHVRIAALDRGAADWLTKPFSFAELRARLRALCERVAERRQELRQQQALMQAELHDGVNASLARTVMLLDAAATQPRPDLVAAARNAAYSALDQARTVLSLQSRDAASFAEARQLLEQHLRSAIAGFDLELTFTERCDKTVDHLDPVQLHTLMRVAVEVALNAVKHAGSQRLRVELSAKEECVELLLRSGGGSGAPAAPDLGTGRGLRLAAKRLEQLGGSLQAGPCADADFQVRAAFPARPPQSPPPPFSD